jgi:DNA-binding PadR family transcriptional regulator
VSQTHIQMLSILQEDGKMSTNTWKKQCEAVYGIKHTTFFAHLKKLRADKLVSEPPEGMIRGKHIDYSITEQGIELLEGSSE